MSHQPRARARQAAALAQRRRDRAAFTAAADYLEALADPVAGRHAAVIRQLRDDLAAIGRPPGPGVFYGNAAWFRHEVARHLRAVRPDTLAVRWTPLRQWLENTPDEAPPGLGITREEASWRTLRARLTACVARQPRSRDQLRDLTAIVLGWFLNVTPRRSRAVGPLTHGPLHR